MTLSEQSKWMAYRDAHGPLDPARRSDIASAIVAAQMTRLKTGRRRVELDPFLPFENQQPTEGVDPFDKFATSLGAAKDG